MGITFTDKREEERQKKLREHPPLVARILKTDPVKLENFFHYYKIHILVGIVLILVVFFSVRSCINQVPADFTMVLTGLVYTEDETTLENDIKQKVPELMAPQVHIMTTGSADPQYEYAMQMKLIAMLSAHEIDILIMDRAEFEKMASQGALVDLEEQKGILPFPEEAYVKGSEVIGENEAGQPVMGPPKVCGVNISGSSYVKENNLRGDSIIAAIVVNSTNMDKALSYLQQIEW